MKTIIEASELPEGEKVYLKKDMFGWRTVEPWKNPETEKINWFNLLLSGKRGLATLIFIMLLVGVLYVGVNELIGNYKEVAANPCNFCSNCFSKTIVKYHEFNFSNLNLSGG